MCGFDDMTRRLYVQVSTAVRKRQDGQTLVEYALILGLLAVALGGALTFFGGHLKAYYDQINNDLTAALP